MTDCLKCGRKAWQGEWTEPAACEGCGQRIRDCPCPPRRGYPVGEYAKAPGRCHCGRPLIARPGEMEPTCGECRSKPDACECTPVQQQAAGPLPKVVRLADVQPERIEWLWPGYLPLGKVVVLDGDPGVGKSTVCLDVAARVSTGSPMPDGSPGTKGAVMVLSAEDGLADTIRPRLDAAQADPAQVITVTQIGEGPEARPVSIPGDLRVIEAVIAEHEVKLVIVDVLMAYLAGEVNAHRDQDIRRALHVLSGVAERRGCCVIILRHLNKSGGANALYRGGGSIGIVGAARAAFMCGRDPDDETGDPARLRQRQDEHRRRAALPRL